MIGLVCAVTQPRHVFSSSQSRRVACFASLSLPPSHSPSRTRKRRREKGPQLSLAPSPQVRQFSERGQGRKRRCFTDYNAANQPPVSTPISDVIRIYGWIAAHHRRGTHVHIWSDRRRTGRKAWAPPDGRAVAVVMKVSGAVSSPILRPTDATCHPPPPLNADDKLARLRARSRRAWRPHVRGRSYLLRSPVAKEEQMLLKRMSRGTCSLAAVLHPAHLNTKA